MRRPRRSPVDRTEQHQSLAPGLLPSPPPPGGTSEAESRQEAARRGAWPVLVSGAPQEGADRLADPPVLRLLADDLTGALDTAARFVPVVGTVPVVWSVDGLASLTGELKAEAGRLGSSPAEPPVASAGIVSTPRADEALRTVPVGTKRLTAMSVAKMPLKDATGAQVSVGGPPTRGGG